jgi:hypothetical protein
MFTLLVRAHTLSVYILFQAEVSSKFTQLSYNKTLEIFRKYTCVYIYPGPQFRLPVLSYNSISFNSVTYMPGIKIIFEI